ncbi:AMP-binding protein [Pseudobacter ginsenosidimutans]|uniref:Acyl-CoA synthetase (AMP-forming)/AMP-acid ligase II n=1 Tax=Pseudobacter ginsenosidimutans TaxID=661488 RepID=A0A4Q7N3M8_9BACT|nr:AMP-binding protein [Pseudobacter ginsenosidimutans]QEC44107.1 D-alanine--poly(phosphoribitol) ligase [Pseudobacter ginsenosidimutans]RZS75548.1 acyl-CoA synthetase (AMP-forming)/AMP-acid ligase II [Pseudobacter ginsenosidimutans]
MDQIFLYNRSKRYSYHDFDTACAALRKKLPSGSNRKVVVLSSHPELYYFAFYFCFTHDFIYCPINIDDTIPMIENKIEIINPGVIITNENFFLSHWREKEQVYEPLHLPSFGSCFLCFQETEIADGFSTVDLRYILFTSGTTGAAKAVPISNANIAAFTDNMQQLFEVEETAVIANTFKFSFDLSIWAMLMAWTNGAAISHIDTDHLLNHEQYAHCTIFCMLPSMLRILQKQQLLFSISPNRTKHFLFCGEPLYDSDVQLLREYFPRAGIYNCYGPTELSIYCSAYKVETEFHTWNRVVSIGQLNIGSKAYLGNAMLLEDGNLEGELYVSGEQTFNGYINLPEGTGFFEYDGEQFYKTGDKVIYNQEEDRYYYAGRVDREVKYYGHRINLNNLEYVFSGIGPISDAAAIFSRKYMTIGLFFTSTPGFKLEENMHLLQHIPNWLRPTHYFPTPEFPLNANFKTDYSALETFYNRYLEKKYPSQQ